MNKYADVNGNSSVDEYSLGEDSIIIKFKGKGPILYYRYTYLSAGQVNVEEMKRLAVQGYGLSSYINSGNRVSKLYASKGSSLELI